MQNITVQIWDNPVQAQKLAKLILFTCMSALHKEPNICLPFHLVNITDKIMVMVMMMMFFQAQTNTELLKVFKEHKHNLDLLTGPSEGLIAALPSLNIIDSKFITSSQYTLHVNVLCCTELLRKRNLFCLYVIGLNETCMCREGRIMDVHLIALSSLFRCILSRFWVCV